MRDFMDWQVAAPKQVTSPTRGPPLPCKHTLSDGVHKVWSVFTHVTCSYAYRPFTSSRNSLSKRGQVQYLSCENDFCLHKNE